MKICVLNGLVACDHTACHDSLYTQHIQYDEFDVPRSSENHTQCTRRTIAHARDN